MVDATLTGGVQCPRLHMFQSNLLLNFLRYFDV